MSAINVPLPGPSSTIRMGEELPFANHRDKNQTPMSYPECQPKRAIKLCLVRRQTSPNTWLISGLVMKSPRAPMMSRNGFV